MTAYIEIARASSPRGEVVLRERREPDGSMPVLELRVNGVFVMDTLETATEQQLAAVALARVASPRTVLVGGLGLGFTAGAVLADPRVEHVLVVEIEPALVTWMTDGTVPHGPSYLADERLTVVTADIRQAVARAAPESYDLLLLDVDNGPGHLVHRENAAVYRLGFLSALCRLLRPGGVAAVWSSAESQELAAHLTVAFGSATAVPMDVRLQGRSERYWLYVATRRSSAPAVDRGAGGSG
jgi:spermidine synthase